MKVKDIVQKLVTPKDVIMFLVGVGAAFYFFYKAYPPVDIQPYRDKIKHLEEIIENDQQVIDSLDNEKGSLTLELSNVNEDYANFRNKVITDKQTDSLQKEEIRKGIYRYGHPGVLQSQPSLATSYGNNAFDELKIQDQMLVNQLKVETVMNDVTIKKDTIIYNQNLIIKEIKKVATKEKIGWFLKGTGFGAVLSILLVLLL